MTSTSHEESVDYDTITGLPKVRHRVPTSPTGPKPQGKRPIPGGMYRGEEEFDDGASTCAGSSMGGTGRSGTGGMTSTGSNFESVHYNTLGDGSGHNVDADAGTMIGIEIKERFNSMRAAFLKMDENRDGRISKLELMHMCKKWNVPVSEAERVLRAADLDHNGTLDFNEFARRFDPYEGGFGDDGSLSPLGQTTSQAMSLGSTADSRAIKSCGWGGGGGPGERPVTSSGWGGAGGVDERTARPEDLHSPAHGSGSRAARALQGEGPGASPRGGGAGVGFQGESPGGGEQGSMIAHLQEENANLRAENEKLWARIAALEEQVAQMGSQAGVPSGSGGGGGGAGAPNNHAGCGERAQPHPQQVETNGQGAAEDEEEMSTVWVYGRKGDKKTEEMCKTLRSAQVPFKQRDYDKDKRYTEPLTQSGGSAGAQPPIVTFAMRAWWEDPNAPKDEMFSIPFSASVAMELRHDLGDTLHAQRQQEAPVRQDADIENEIAERFSSMRQAFLKLDTNSDGRITKKELLAKCKEWNIPQSEAERALAEADVDHDGTLDFNEFARHFNGVASGGHTMTHSIKGGANSLSGTMRSTRGR